MTFFSESSDRLSLPSAAPGAESAIALSDLQDEITTLFDELRDRLLRYMICCGLSLADGEEIVQEAFLLLFRHLQQGRSRRNLRGWLFRVTHNLGLKRRLRNGKHRDWPVLDMADEFPAHVDRAPSPEEHAAFFQRQLRLLAALRALPEQDQQCLRLRAEGLRYREIAEILGISLGGVSASLARSLTRLGRVGER
jgi:RNA polymerase sigma-70 factor, ECF subfamily